LVLQKRFQVTKVKIAISCCTHSFFTQLTSSPCIRRSKKNQKQENRQKKLLQKDWFGEMQQKKLIVKIHICHFLLLLLLLMLLNAVLSWIVVIDLKFSFDGCSEN